MISHNDIHPSVVAGRNGPVLIVKTVEAKRCTRTCMTGNYAQNTKPKTCWVLKLHYKVEGKKLMNTKEKQHLLN